MLEEAVGEAKAILESNEKTVEDMEYIVGELLKFVLTKKKENLTPLTNDQKKLLIVKIRTRFEQYRIGFEKDCQLWVQYQPYVTRCKEEDRVYIFYEAKLKAGYCCSNSCSSVTVIDGKTPVVSMAEDFRQIEFDHKYDQSFIKVSFTYALRKALEVHNDECQCGAGDHIFDTSAFKGFVYNHSEPSPQAEPTSIDANTAAGSRQLKILFLRYHLHMETLVEDLYNNFALLCITCHGKKNAVPVVQGRYVKEEI